MLLSTHFMDEAQALADRIVVIVGGLIVAEGTADQVIGARPPGRSSGCACRPMPPRYRLPWRLLPALAGTGRSSCPTTEPTTLLHALTGWAIGSSVELSDLTVSRPSLEDAYLALVAEHGGQADGAAAAGSDRSEGADGTADSTADGTAVET